MEEKYPVGTLVKVMPDANLMSVHLGEEVKDKILTVMDRPFGAGRFVEVDDEGRSLYIPEGMLKKVGRRTYRRRC